MKKRFCIILIFIILFTIGCESKSPAVNSAAEEKKVIIPFEDRRFIYTNGITIESKQTDTKDDKGVKVTYYYPVISGLKNKTVQDKINKEFIDVEKQQIGQLETKLLSTNMSDKLKINQKMANSYISYNCNNVIFVEYNANMDARQTGDNYYPIYNYTSYGYDLNTGERIDFEDLFIAGSDYKTKLNNFVSQYLIENNYDDFEYERMSKPFQGIRENQSFTFGTEGLRIVIDDKNDEFINYGYPDQVLIPLKYIADDLYIFDKYFNEEQSIFEKNKLSKKLLPNKMEFKANKLIKEINDNYYISITQGEFINVPNKDIEKKLNEMVVSSFDIEDFKNKVKASTTPNRNSNYIYNIVLYTNAGNYLSMAVMESKYLEGKFESKITPFNYDFNLNKEMQLRDIYENVSDIVKVLKKNAKQMNYPINEEMLDNTIKEAIKSNKFYFQEFGICIYLPIKDSKLNDEQKWIWIDFRDLGADNIKLFK